MEQEFKSEEVDEMWRTMVESKPGISLPFNLYQVQRDALCFLLNGHHLFFILNTGKAWNFFHDDQ